MSTQTTQDGNREQLQELLRDLFQFDAADLDFGVYRILNQRRDRIEQFIKDDLLNAVDESLESLADAKRAEIEQELEEKATELRQDWDDDIFNPDGSLKDQYENLGQKDLEEYQDLWETRKDVAVAEEAEARIFNDLYRFFSRYYEDGDFHTKRRISSKDSKYYVPYNGEETYFHWANNDQYYVKTGEHFTDYRFDADEWTVEFRLEDADVPQDNVKGDKRYFVLGRGDPVSTDADEQTVTIRYQYRQITEDEADDCVEAYNEATGDDRSSFTHMTPEMRCDALEGRILSYVEDAGAERILTAEKDDDATSTVLKSHLNRYVSENSMDYFVHKDLQNFLEDELEFFLQNEVLDVDELIKADDASSPPVLRARTVREIAERIISFLAQIEDFQKRLFEKKKFVVQTDYMVTLDQVPDDLYNEILENNDQLERWREIYNIDQWDTQGYEEPNEAFLANHPYLMIDTALFDQKFKLDFLTSIKNIDKNTDGVLVNGENFQSLNLLTEKYHKSVDCTYIDPPYNTGARDFMYKDSYQHSSWISMMADRLSLDRSLLSGDGVIFTSIDDNEYDNLKRIQDSVFGPNNFIANIIWQKVFSPKNSARWFSEDHDYILAYAKDKQSWQPELLPRSDEAESRYSNPDDDPRGPWTSSDLTARNYYSEGEYEVESPSGKTFSPPQGRYWTISENDFLELDDDDRIWWGEDGSNMPRRKRFLSEVKQGVVPQTLWTYDEVGHTQKAKKELLATVSFNRSEDVLNSVKPTALIERILQVSKPSDTTSHILDFFAGSGTTAHSTINFNRKIDGRWRYTLIEMGEYFDTMILPRIQRIVFSSEWEDGFPQKDDGVSHLVKYHRLESYEDALNNIELQALDNPQQKLVDENVDEYIEGYLLNLESEGSAPLLPEGTFEEPFDHKLRIEQNGKSREPTTVDLVETFHYLIGADVLQYWHETHQDRKYVVTECEINTKSGVEKTLTAWRQTEDIDYDEEKEWFDNEFRSDSYDRVYVNGESQIAKSEPLEITFREKMEESPNVA